MVGPTAGYDFGATVTLEAKQKKLTAHSQRAMQLMCHRAPFVRD